MNNDIMRALDSLVATTMGTVAPSMAVAIYFRAPVADYEAGVIYCLESFLALYGKDLTFYADEDIGRIRKATPKLLHYPIDRIRNRSRKMPFFAWAMHAGNAMDAASPISFESYVREDDRHKLSYVRASFPPHAYSGLEGANQFAALVTDWAGRLPFFHGYGGLALNQSAQAGTKQGNSKIVFALASRFPGFEVDDCGGTVLVAQEAIKGINWLTLLGDKFGNRLGGIASLRKKLSNEIELVPVPNRGLMIRAGKEPGTGDVNRGHQLPLYQEVSRALLPIRMVQHPALGPIEFGSFGPQGTEAWLKRFD